MSLAAIFAGPVLKALVGPILGVIDKHLDRSINRDKLAAEIEQALIAGATEASRQGADVVIAEAKGESWLQRNWRPVVAMVSFFSCWFVIFPYAFFVQWGWLPQVRFGEAGLQYFFTLSTICVGGYVGARSFEKIAGTIWGKR